MLSLPWSFAGASLFGGLAVMYIAMLWTAWTNVVMVMFAERTKQFVLGKMLGEIPGGRLWEPLGNLVMLSTNFLVCTGNLVVFADTADQVVLQTMLGFEYHQYTRRCLIALMCCIVFPLCLLDQEKLAVVSLVSVAANWFVCFVMLREVSVAETFPQVCAVGWGVGDMTLLAVVMQAVSFQQNILPIYQEMQVRRVSRFMAVQIWSMVGAAFLLTLMAIAGYLLYGGEVSSNVLLDLPQTPLNIAAQAAIIPVMLGLYPQLQYPITVAFREFFVQRAERRQSVCSPLPSPMPTPRHIAVAERWFGRASRSEPPPLPSPMPTPKYHAVTEYFRKSRGSSPREVPLLAGERSPPLTPRTAGSWTLLSGIFGVIVATGLVAGTGIDLGPVNNAAGILGLGWCTTAMPGIVYFRLLQLDRQSNKVKWALLFVHFSFGAVLTALSLAFPGNHIESLEQHCSTWWSGDQ